MKLSVIIPVYNEEATIAAVITKVREVQLPPGLAKEIIIVDDGSKDRTPLILEGHKGSSGTIILRQKNQGKTSALLTGINASSGDILIVQDADLEYDPCQYPQLLAPILKGEAHVVYGSRFLGNIEGMEPINRGANRLSNWTINLLFGTRMTDVNTCYKVFTRRAFEGIDIKGRHFDFDTEVTVKFLHKGLSIREVPIRYAARSRAAGKKMKWSTALRMFWAIIKHRCTSSAGGCPKNTAPRN